MIDGGYKIRDQQAAHFITFSVVEWVDVFTRKYYADIVVESLKFCQKEKGLNIHAWCIIPSALPSPAVKGTFGFLTRNIYIYHPKP